MPKSMIGSPGDIPCGRTGPSAVYEQPAGDPRAWEAGVRQALTRFGVSPADAERMISYTPSFGHVTRRGSSRASRGDSVVCPRR